MSFAVVCASIVKTKSSIQMKDCSFMRVVLLLTALAGCSPSPEQIALATCRTAIQDMLVDPLSAQFTGEKRVSGDHTATTYALTVNARNKLGGYSGREVRECSVDPSGLKVIYLSRGEH